jgi:hypothetical protein
VIEQWYKYAEYLNEQKIRHVVNVLNVFIKDTGAAHRGRVCIYMNEVKNAERDNAGYLMQLT